MRDYLIIGGGILGIATAHELISCFPNAKITVVEKEEKLAQHQTGNNSGVIHTGIYYKPGSLKAKNCVAGRKELLRFCEEEGIPLEKTGKVLVATKDVEISRLQRIKERGEANGVLGLKILCAKELKEIEPFASAKSSLWVPHCHITHFPSVVKKLAEKIKNSGVEILTGESVLKITSRDEITVETQKNSLQTRFLINCGGLHSDRLAKMAMPEKHLPYKIFPFRGEYYELSKEKSSMVRGLIYPVPDPEFPFLGVHFTKKIDGSVEAGPNAVLSMAREGYSRTHFSLRDMKEMFFYKGFWMMSKKYWKMGLYEYYRSISKKQFLRSLRALIPSLESNDLIPGGAGVRAQLVNSKGNLHDDFAIMQEKNMLHVLNAPSPAATASFAISKEIVNRIKGVCS